jgi:hypothetical protein
MASKDTAILDHQAEVVRGISKGLLISIPLWCAILGVILRFA